MSEKNYCTRCQTPIDKRDMICIYCGKLNSDRLKIDIPLFFLSIVLFLLSVVVFKFSILIYLTGFFLVVYFIQMICFPIEHIIRNLNIRYLDSRNEKLRKIIIKKLGFQLDDRIQNKSKFLKSKYFISAAIRKRPSIVEKLTHDLRHYVSLEFDELWVKEKKCFFYTIILLREIGPDAAKSIPDLIQLLNYAKYKDVIYNFVCTAVEALGKIGETARDAIPSLLNLILNSNIGISNEAVKSVAKIDLYQDDVIRKLIETRMYGGGSFGDCEEDYYESSRSSASHILSNISGKDFGRNEKLWLDWWKEYRQNLPEKISKKQKDK